MYRLSDTAYEAAILEVASKKCMRLEMTGKNTARCLYAALALSLCAAPFFARAGTLYKWVDKNGEVHYGDHIPPQYLNQKHSILNQEGVTLETVQPPSPAELQAKKRAEEQAARDRRLLDTYGSVREIVRVRNSKIAAVDYVIRMTQGNIEKLNRQLNTLTKTAADMELNGQAVPPDLIAQIKTTQQQIRANQAFIAAKRREQDQIRAQFEADIKRFRELMAQRERAAQQQKQP